MNGEMQGGDAKEEPKKYLGVTASGWIKLTVLGVLIGAILVAFLVFDAHKRLKDLLDWIDENKAIGFFVFAAFYCLATVLFIPGLILSLGAGFVFGPFLGVLAVWVGATVGQTFAFLIGRYLFRDWIATKTEKFVRWQAIETAIREEGWKIIFLLRLAPVVPYNALNYALGLTAAQFLHYTIASAIGILPGSIMYVYIGSLADNIRDISSGDGGSTTFIITAVASAIAIVVVVVLITYYAKRALAKRLAVPGDQSIDASLNRDEHDVEAGKSGHGISGNE